MIAVSLAVIVLICALLLANHRRVRETHVRQQGKALARVLADLPLTELLPHEGRYGVARALVAGLRDTSLAYVAVVSPAGELLLDVSSPGVAVPDVDLSAAPSARLTEISLDLDGRPVMEFRTPIFEAAEVAAYLRVGCFVPTFVVTRDHLPFLATIALLVFLLTPSFQWLFKREIKPFTKLRMMLASTREGDPVQPTVLDAGDALHDFLETFSQFVEDSQRRIADLEEHHGDLITTSKLIGYQRARSEAVIQSLPDGILVLDEVGVAVLANSKLASWVSVDPADVVGKRPSDWVEEDELLAYLERCQAKSNRGYVSESVEYSPASAPEKTVGLTAYPLFVRERDGGSPAGTLIVFRDVTLESLAKAARGEFVAHVAHELKSPLSVLRMYSEELLNTEELTEELKVEAVNVIHDEVDRLSTLISNLLSLTKIEMGSLSVERQRVKLNELLEDALQTLSRGGRGAGLHFHLRLPRELSPVAVDKELLRVAINNLLTNAIKYNHPGGDVTLAAEESDEAIRISVQDTGIGMDEQDKGRVFDKFFRSDSEQVREKSGHGLGLALARQIVELHHGTLSVNSVLGEGSVFVIELRKEPGLVKQAI